MAAKVHIKWNGRPCCWISGLQVETIKNEPLMTTKFEECTCSRCKKHWPDGVVPQQNGGA
jgi:hypothetical protein